MCAPRLWRSGRGSALVEGDADGAAPGVGPDDRADVADDDVARVVRSQHVDELVDVAAVGVQHGEVLDRRRSSTSLSTRNASAFERVRCLPPCSTLPSRTSMIGLIASADASSALAPPMRPPFFRLSSVSSAPHTLVRVGQVAGARPTTSSRSAPRAASRAQSATIMPRPSVQLRLSTTVTGTSVGHVPGGQLGALHGGRQRGAERDDDDAGGAPRSASRAVRGLELAGRRCRRLGQVGRRGAPRPELGRCEVAPIDELVTVDADGERDDLDAELVGDGLWRSQAESVTMTNAGDGCSRGRKATGSSVGRQFVHRGHAVRRRVPTARDRRRCACAGSAANDVPTRSAAATGRRPSAAGRGRRAS